MANIWEKYISILAKNLNSGLTYFITTVLSNREFLKKEKEKTFGENLPL